MLLQLTIHLNIDIHIRISKEEMRMFGGRSLELTDGSGYVGSLEVYHDLHCLVLSNSPLVQSNI